MSRPIYTNKFTIIISGMLALSILASCETKQQSGALMGGTAGALLGSQFGKGRGQIVGVGIGALLGAFAGSEVGKYMDGQDKMKMQAATQRTLERSSTGQTSSWRNPDSGNSGKITATRTFQEDGRYCREFNQTITVGGKTEKGYGTACRQPDGSWQIIN